MLHPSLPLLTSLAYRQCATAGRTLAPDFNSLRYYTRSLNSITTHPYPSRERGVMGREATLSAVVNFASERRINSLGSGKFCERAPDQVGVRCDTLHPSPRSRTLPPPTGPLWTRASLRPTLWTAHSQIDNLKLFLFLWNIAKQFNLNQV